MSAIRVAIADHQPLSRRGIQALLSTTSDLELIGQAEDGTSAQRVVMRLNPDILITELKLPCLSGLQVARHLARRAPRTKIIILTGYHQEDLIFEALRAGVYAYLLKETEDSNLLEAIRLVSQGKRLLSPALMDTVLRQLQFITQAHVQNEYKLSPQDLTILSLMANGVSCTQIALEMHWSDRTVKRRIDQIMTKLGSKNRIQMIAEAVRRGLV